MEQVTLRAGSKSKLKKYNREGKRDHKSFFLINRFVKLHIDCDGLLGHLAIYFLENSCQ